MSTDSSPISGSSPLARGLLDVDQFSLIPLVDHPRSRGVYFGLVSTQVDELGSSPLARGLPTQSVGWCQRGGIIPARAGFTNHCEPLRLEYWDHPRSRGVYASLLTKNVSFGGSSPLARGLPADESVGRYTVRIIPARAGFTFIKKVQACAGKDHPRSRGVYASPRACRMGAQGSSPLARGLPCPPWAP